MELSIIAIQVSMLTSQWLDMLAHLVFSFMNKLTNDKRRAVVSCLVEGNSIRSTVHMTGVAKATVSKLLVDLGAACEKFHHATVRNVQSNRIECDEIWSFVGAKAKNVPAEKEGFWGDVWTWTAIDPESKLFVSYLVGGRGAGYAASS